MLVEKQGSASPSFSVGDMVTVKQLNVVGTIIGKKGDMWLVKLPTGSTIMRESALLQGGSKQVLMG